MSHTNMSQNNTDTEMTIGQHKIGASHPPFIIAEMSANHNGSLARAHQIIEAIAASGAQSVKLQTYRPQDMTLDIAEGDFSEDFYISEEGNPWKGRTAYSLYSEAATPWKWHKELFDKAKSLGLEIFSSPFSIEAVDFLEELGVPAYKIASFENNHIPLIEKAASTGKPLIISCGMASEDDIVLAVTSARNAGCRELMLLKCTSSYPAAPESTNLRTIADMQQKFGCLVGFSDHTLGTAIPTAAIAAGAVAIEKHISLAKDDGGPDGHFSADPAEMKQLVEDTHTAWQAMGAIKYGCGEEEKVFVENRRSIYVTCDIKADEILTENNIAVIRPGYGLHPKHFNDILGKKVNKNLSHGEPIKLEDII